MSTEKNCCAVILAGGQGKRMKSDLPKPMLKVLGEPMIDWVLSSCRLAGIEKTAVITGHGRELLEEHIGDRARTFFQSERLGTGHALMQALPFLKENSGGDVIVLCGDAPFVGEDVIRGAYDAHISSGAAVTVVTAELENPYGYGRVIKDGDTVLYIVEQKDASGKEAAVKEINSGVYWFKVDSLIEALGEIRPNNSQGEYYLTDAVELILKKGGGSFAYKTDDRYAVLAANDRMGMLELNRAAAQSVIERHLENGVELVSTDGVIIERRVKIGRGSQILPGTILRGNTVIGENCVIGPGCIIENTSVGDGSVLNNVQSYDSIIEDNVKIGPFVQIRPGSHIKSGVKIGDFVEIKNSVIGEKTAVAHLTYVGDSDVGSLVNFGCGCVTVNYDGVNKHRTKIGDRAFIGCNTNLIAPVTIGNGAYTGAGSTVAKDVPDNALAVERAPLKIREGYTDVKFKDKKWK